LEGVEVRVARLQPEVERSGVSAQHLTTAVEGQLRQAGIPVLTAHEALTVPGRPSLSLRVHLAPRAENVAAYTISVALQQRVSLEPDAPLTTVSTWSVGSTGRLGGACLAVLHTTVRDHVDQFISAYLSVNPRSAGSAAPLSASLHRDCVRQGQERLQPVGFNPGTIDGTLGPQTQQALRGFQNAQGLRITGDLDDATRTALGVR